MRYISTVTVALFEATVMKMIDLEVPERAEYVRVILCELNRIASHLLYVGTIGLDAGAMTPTMMAFRGRERIKG